MEDPRTVLFEQAAERVAEIKRKLPQSTRDSKQNRNNFSSSLYQKWKPALDLFDAMIAYTTMSVTGFVEKNNAHAAAEENQVYKILVYLYHRVQHTVGEINTLMRSGYPVAAFARWRLLYEYSIFAQFIVQHGTDVAQAYQEFHVMDVVDVMRAFRAVSATKFGLEPFDAEEDAILQTYEADLQKLCTKYQVSDRDQLGWTISVFPSGRRTMNRLVRSVEEEYLSRGVKPENLDRDLWPFYVLSNTLVHASSMATSLPGGSPMLRTLEEYGPSMIGLLEPAQVTIESFFIFVRTLLNTIPTEDTFIDIQVLSMLRTDTLAAFLQRESTHAAR